MSGLLQTCATRAADPSLSKLESTGAVEIYHPASRTLPFLVFHAYPAAPDATASGVLLGVVLDACFIVARNRAGQLLRFAAPNEQLTDDHSDVDALLEKGEYIFVVTEGGWDENYPLCQDFAAWTPPGSIPTRWNGPPATLTEPPASAASQVSLAVKLADGACIMTGAETATCASHLVPKSEDQWFKQHHNTVKIYGGDGSRDLNRPCNQVTLRADLIAQGLDQGIFLFAPHGPHVVAVFLGRMGPDLAYLYHLKEVRMPTRIIRGYLFVRFAWNVFKSQAPDLANIARAIGNEMAGFSDVGGKRKGQASFQGHTPKKANTGAGGGSGGGNEGDLGGSIGGGGGDVGGAHDGDGEESLPTEDDENGPRTGEGESAPVTDDVKAMLAVYDAQDAALQASPYLTVGDVAAGRYPGFSKVKRLEHEYRLANPQVSAVGNATRMGR
ncbi:hypothetical protein DFH09DRAFT_1184413 [Mycena vulgaris]|nr:hypothetical protein DFH09DRAFT_1184413 [Mycena vulgaris]